MSQSQSHVDGPTPVAWDGYPHFSPLRPIAYRAPATMAPGEAAVIIEQLVSDRALLEGDFCRAAGWVAANKIKKADRLLWMAEHGPTAEDVAPATHRRPLDWRAHAQIDGTPESPAYTRDRGLLPRGVYYRLGRADTIDLWFVDRHHRATQPLPLPPDAQLVSEVFAALAAALDRLDPEPDPFDAADADDDEPDDAGEEWQK